jgi:hypothetical protein
MTKAFPEVPLPDLSVPAGGAVAFAYLQARVRFDIPYFENDEGLLFTDGAGRRAKVRSFGVRDRDDYAYWALRNQIAVLYRSRDEHRPQEKVGEFILDPCASSQPNQLVLACIPSKPTLAQTLGDVEERITSSPRQEWARRFGPRDVLLVPSMRWRIGHHFRELEDKRYLNPAVGGMYLSDALQTIEFGMDRGGAELASEAKHHVAPPKSVYRLDRSFLMYMKRRGAKHPFFIIWVDNAELLARR